MPGRQSSPELIGRTGELGQLVRALERASSGAGTSVLLTGESGVGKTRLLTEFVGQVRDRATVLAGACLDIADGPPPYWPVLDALGTLPEAVGLPGIPGTGAPDVSVDAGSALDAAGLQRAQEQRFALLLEALRAAARRRPVVLVIEDLHWSDRSTRDLLTYLGGHLPGTAVLLILSYRSDAVAADRSLVTWLGERLRAGTEFIDLPRLTRPEVTAQLTSILGGPPKPEIADAVWMGSEGNAFFAEEILAALVSGRSEIPATLRQVLSGRLALLSGPAAQALAMVSAAGSPVRHDLLAAIGLMSEADLLKATREAVEHQVLLVDSRTGGYSFRHALLRDSVDEQLLPAERTTLHRLCAQALEADPQRAVGSARAAIAAHWFAAGDPERAVPALLEAAAEAEAGSGFAEACLLLERALGLWDRAPRATGGLDHAQVLLQAAELANLAGDHDRAVQLAERAIDVLGPDQPSARSAGAWERLGRFQWDAGASEDALAAYRRAAELTAADRESPVGARVLGAQASALMLAGRYQESQPAAEEALALARRLGLRREEGEVLAVLGFDLAYLGNPAGTSLLHDARAIAEADGDADAIARSFIHLARLLSEPLSLFDEAISVADEGIARARDLGLERFHGAALQALAVNTLFRVGRWGEAGQRLQEAFDRNPEGAAALDLALARAKISMATGDFAGAAADLRAVAAGSTRAVDPRFLAPVLTLEAGLALFEGRLDDARQAVAEGMARLSASQEVWFAGPLVWHGLRAEADRAQQARVHRATGELEGARATGRDLLERLGRLAATLDPAAQTVHRTVAAYQLMSEAEWTRLEGRSSPDLWVEAAATWVALEQPYPATYAGWRLAEAYLATQARSAAAAQAVREAHAQAVGLGAEPLRREVEALAARAGIKLASPAGGTPPAQSMPPARSDPAAGSLAPLTPREVEVLRLVARAHTNREIADLLFISVKTAGVHVSHILEKLGLRSRVEASAYAQRAGLLDDPGA
ncbi:MAG TPA: AAA family ATPase [Actinomycetota bacterium]|nr:AAA family ATPase [Actinomycetota bacterium]